MRIIRKAHRICGSRQTQGVEIDFVMRKSETPRELPERGPEYLARRFARIRRDRLRKAEGGLSCVVF